MPCANPLKISLRPKWLVESLYCSLLAIAILVLRSVNIYLITSSLLKFFLNDLNLVTKNNGSEKN